MRFEVFAAVAATVRLGRKMFRPWARLARPDVCFYIAGQFRAHIRVRFCTSSEHR